MYQGKGYKTIFDDVKAHKIEKASIPEDDIVKPKSSFHINKDKFESSVIVNDYKIPTFKFSKDDSFNEFFDYPDISLSQNPIYKYKYPKLSEAEYAKQQLQTEAGTPNELNTFMRHDILKESIQDIQQSDNAFQAGLNELQKLIDEDTEKIKNAYNNAKDETKKEQIKEIQERRAKQLNKADSGVEDLNPVLKNKVYRTTKGNIPTEKEARIMIRKVFDDGIKDNPDTKLLKQLTEETAKPNFSKKLSKKHTENLSKLVRKHQEAQQNTLIQSKPEPTAEPAAEPTPEPAAKPAAKPKTPLKSTLKHVSTTPVSKSRKRAGGEEGGGVSETKASEPDENDEVDTVIGDVVKVPQHLQQYYIEAQNILNSPALQSLRPQASLDTTQKGKFFSIFEELNSLNQAVSSKKTVQPIKKVGTFRNKFLIQFKT